MGTTADGGKGSKGRAAKGDRPKGAASSRPKHTKVSYCPPKSKATIVGKSDIYHWGNLIGPFLVHKLLPPPPPPPPPSSKEGSAGGVALGAPSP